MNYTTSKMYSCHLLLWAYHQRCLHSYFWHYASTENRLLRVGSSSLECTLLKSPDLFYAYAYILRTLWIRQIAIFLCHKKKPSPFYNWAEPQAAQQSILTVLCFGGCLGLSLVKFRNIFRYEQVLWSFVVCKMMNYHLPSVPCSYFRVIFSSLWDKNMKFKVSEKFSLL